MKIERGLNGRHVLLMLIGFFGVIFAANTAFVLLAVRTFPGEVEKKSYMQGLQYNDTLAARAEQERLGWRAELTRVEQSKDGGGVEIQIFDRNDNPLSGLTITGFLRRPAHQDSDQDLTFASMGGGIYFAEAGNLTAGVWDLSALATDQLENRFVVDARVNVE